MSVFKMTVFKMTVYQSYFSSSFYQVTKKDTVISKKTLAFIWYKNNSLFTVRFTCVYLFSIIEHDFLRVYFEN